MVEFTAHFFICNIVIAAIAGLIFLLRYLLGNVLCSSMQYGLWLVMIFLMAVPFFPFQVSPLSDMAFHMGRLFEGAFIQGEKVAGRPADMAGQAADMWLNDFTVSVTSGPPAFIWRGITAIWVAGMVAMAGFAVRSWICLRKMEKSSFPIMEESMRGVYRQCLHEAGLKREIPIYAAPFLKSPALAGFVFPKIYIPLSLLYDWDPTSMRYMLLHELQHYKRRDGLANYMMAIAYILYWFNPAVRKALREMKSDREVACDTAVLNLIGRNEYGDYGNTLLDFAEKISSHSFSFASELGGSMRQMKKRIKNIADYRRPTFGKRMKGWAVCAGASAVLLCFVPVLSVGAADDQRYAWDMSKNNVQMKNFESYFGKFEGAFVLYDWKRDRWTISDEDQAVKRRPPDSTYKIYGGLMGLEEGIIAVDDFSMAWDGENYAFEAWNMDQTLESAIKNSVNWYFQAIDRQAGKEAVGNFLKKTGYGNQNISGGLDGYWLESSLKISPVEQVEKLTALYENTFGFQPEHIQAVKNGIRLAASAEGELYGKTGTGQVNHQDVNGWFVGYVEKTDNVYFFAVNISGEEGAAGMKAAEIALGILEDMDIWSEKERRM